MITPFIANDSLRANEGFQTTHHKCYFLKHELLGAGCLVPEGKVLESGYLYLGRPAKKIRPLTPEEIAHFMYSANNYIQLKNRYLGEF